MRVCRSSKRVTYSSTCHSLHFCKLKLILFLQVRLHKHSSNSPLLLSNALSSQRSHSTWQAVPAHFLLKIMYGLYRCIRCTAKNFKIKQQLMHRKIRYVPEKMPSKILQKAWCHNITPFPIHSLLCLNLFSIILIWIPSCSWQQNYATYVSDAPYNSLWVKIFCCVRMHYLQMLLPPMATTSMTQPSYPCCWGKELKLTGECWILKRKKTDKTAPAHFAQHCNPKIRKTRAKTNDSTLIHSWNSFLKIQGAYVRTKRPFSGKQTQQGQILRAKKQEEDINTRARIKPKNTEPLRCVLIC